MVWFEYLAVFFRVAKFSLGGWGVECITFFVVEPAGCYGAADTVFWGVKRLDAQSFHLTTAVHVGVVGAVCVSVGLHDWGLIRRVVVFWSREDMASVLNESAPALVAPSYTAESDTPR